MDLRGGVLLAAVLVLPAQPLWAADIDEDAATVQAVQRQKAYFHRCYAEAKKGTSLDQALKAAGIELSGAAGEEETNQIRAGLCSYAFKAAAEELPDDVTSFWKLYRRDALCALAGSTLRNAATYFEIFYADNVRYPRTLKEAGMQDLNGVDIKVQVSGDAQSYRLTATIPECDKAFSKGSDAAEVEATRLK